MTAGPAGTVEHQVSPPPGRTPNAGSALLAHSLPVRRSGSGLSFAGDGDAEAAALVSGAVHGQGHAPSGSSIATC